MSVFAFLKVLTAYHASLLYISPGISNNGSVRHTNDASNLYIFPILDQHCWVPDDQTVPAVVPTRMTYMSGHTV